jgi:sugar phosphate isomerase/epimerase
MHSVSRRDFLSTAAALSATALLPLGAREATRPPTSPRHWPVGCFNRPWTQWGYDAALDGMKAAGYKLTGLLTTSKEEPLVAATATPEYLAGVKKRIAARGLTANMGALRVKNESPLAEAIADVRAQLSNAHTLGCRYALTFGVNKPEHYKQYFKVMADAAAFAHERKIQLVLKPHGGGSGASDEIKKAMQAVGHPNFKVWYDAGNIIFYTGKDPVADVEPIAEYVTGFCAKDCDKQRGEVMIQFGAGKVDFVGVFKKLKAAGFNGPIMVEGCKIGATPQETTENAKANRLFLEQVLAQV